MGYFFRLYIDFWFLASIDSPLSKKMCYLWFTSERINFPKLMVVERMTKKRTTFFSLILSTSFFLIFPCLSITAYPDGYYDVYRVIDGDTFELTNGETVRLIGINTPEIGEKCSYEASKQLSSIISGKTVYLERDVSETDGYDRLLRYVYANGTFVNSKLVYDGFAYAVEYPPDTKYDSEFANAESSARAAGRGCLWTVACPSSCYVHITATGRKYHAADCGYLSQSNISICRDDAINQGYTACSICEGKCDGSSDSSAGDGGCFIATAIYGSSIVDEVIVLKKIRDKYLLSNSAGRSFVTLYYRYSPPIANYLAAHETLGKVMRMTLMPVVYSIKYPIMAISVFILSAMVMIRRRVRKSRKR